MCLNYVGGTYSGKMTRKTVSGSDQANLYMVPRVGS